MICNDITEKKRQRNLFTFLQSGKHHFLNSMGYNNRKGPLITRGIFGAPLKSASLCGSTSFEYGLTVPDPVYRCFEEILKRGLQTEGIFRLSGAAPEVEHLLIDFDAPPTYGKYLDLRQYDIHAITGVVKKFLRQLPDPAIPIASHEKFLQFYDESFSDESTIHTLASMIQQLPREHFHLIYYIIILSSNIQAHASINMMNPEALAVVLAPVCTGLEQNLKEIPSWKKHSRLKLMNDMGLFMETNAKWTKIWTLLIEYSDTLLSIWKQAIIRDNVITPPGRNTVPCHPPVYLKEMSHPNRNNIVPFTSQSELILDVAPPQHIPKRPNSSCNHEELYKVVVLRTNPKSLRQNSKRSCPQEESVEQKRHSMIVHSSLSSSYLSQSSISLSSLTTNESKFV
ncbi:Rho GTPase activation protein [Choanephora cucurbitarum]|nr:Rho GTPase activation protein [Choanephora cucurbitarum]